ncbi:MAG TPA: alpha/beta fold hydrolase [Candidatus Polarisedimenticolia bacterium]|nr:alpha/beta fold hydrolase [Candidatus Polarisedimenticolia bacterium]
MTETLFSNMKAGNLASAYGMFDSRMQGAVSPEKLKSIWSDQLSAMGPLASWTITQRLQSQGVDVRIVLLKFDHGTLQATVAIHPDTKEVAGFVIKPPPSTAKPAPPASYVHPADFRASEIKIGSAPYVLGGTLCEPVGLGPFPAAVLIHGSGPQDRDETIGANKVFKDIAEGLASSGVAVLRYDKRTFVYGAQIGDSISVEDEVMVDAASAIAALRARPEIDPKRIFVIGHSMGALLAPEIAVRDGSVAGVACLAPPGRPVGDIVIDQMKFTGASPKDVAEMEQKVARMKAGTLGTERFFGAPQSYWRDLDSRDGIGMAKKLGKPILVMRGDRDFQVGAQDLAAWKAGLAGMEGATVETIPGLSHLFIAGEGKPSPSEYDKPGHVDERVIQKLTLFIKPAKS